MTDLDLVDPSAADIAALRAGAVSPLVRSAFDEYQREATDLRRELARQSANLAEIHKIAQHPPCYERPATRAAILQLSAPDHV